MTLTLALILWYCVLCCSGAALPVDNVADHKLDRRMQWNYEKRPFCNAFTGCGKKRTSERIPYPIIKRNPIEAEKNNFNNDYVAEGLSDLFDVNAEPAVENVQKQIMSQAKIYEAIKEASKEIFRQKNQQQLRNRLRQQRQKMLNEEQDKYNANENENY
uniref:Uncharacterized protein n=1 Tax=Glossina morsitans morsitans TaxID=37546 RepID=A0A1B0G7Y1_GLOMM